MNIENYYNEAVRLLKRMIEIPSFSEKEDRIATLIFDYLRSKKIKVYRKKNNVWAKNKNFTPNLPTLLLNSHLDTVLPNSGYTNNPFVAIEENGKVYGLGSNDAGGCVVSLIQVFLHYMYHNNLKYNIILAITAEEEISGKNGIESIFNELGNIDFAMVGEPTQMHLAIAEKGLMVIDCIAHGQSGHAAREEGENAIYNALKDIQWFRNFTFPRRSALLGTVKMTITIITAGSQHNIVPDICQFTVDIRTTDVYTNDEILEIIKNNIHSTVCPRSTRLNPSFIAESHPIVLAGIKWGRKIYGSPTTSDQALLPIPSLKIGPGNSMRSHIADEFIHSKEIREGIMLYIKMLNDIIL